ncbi:MAG: T9SS type A sorting domain-containing protein, partial [Candidatus Marinimicrobia bacterium]|nr:T9SS type A sorting domain-containing protein [Candidatus Neomarinimicrobiota bacterium]
WSRQTDGFITAMPAIGNVDADPEYEVVFGAYDQKLYVINHDSSNVSGFPRNIGKNIRGGVALADVNADGYDEIVYGEYGGQVSILDVQGNTLSGWPKTTTGSISGEPCVIVTGDHDAIILIGNDQGDMYGYDLNGTQRFMVDGYGAIKASPALLREGDAIYAAFGASSGELYLIDVMNGALLPDWPKTIGPVYQSLAFADVVNDTEETQQVLAVGNDGLIYAFTKQGQNVPGFPVNIRYLSKSSLAFADIDHDGDNEIICGTYSGISVIDLKEGLGGSYWPLHRGNKERSGAIFTMVSAVKEIDVPVEFEFELIGNAPNPFNPLTMIKYTVSDSAPVVLRIYSLNGKQILEKEIGEPSAGTNLIPLDMSGFSSGLYLYSLEHNKVVKKAKMIYLK